MNNNLRLTLPVFFDQTVKNHAERHALALVGEKPLTYAEIDLGVKALMSFLEKLGFAPGDRAAILSTNLPNWGISYYAVTFMGGVTVPLLPDFHSNEIETILNHSQPKVLFIADSLRKKINEKPISSDLIIIRIEDFSILSGGSTGIKYLREAKPAKEYRPAEDDLAAIIYTSGTTGKSKGVMLTHKNLCFTAMMGDRVQEINSSDRFLSVLPLSHTYENTLGMILPMLKGASVHYLGKAPTPSVLLPALKEVKPTVMLTVPLIIEKIFRNVIEPKFKNSPILRSLTRIDPVRRAFYRMAGKKLMKTFGGELKFYGIGGAKLNRKVEEFLIEAKFPYAIGYGLTETSPLLAGFNPQNYRLQSTGKAIDNIELIINDMDPLTGEGEIWGRGPNVMKGYYKEPELTKEILTEDGWIKTGDLGVFDMDGYLYIKGRKKNMIVRSGGENIYPEEIESVINNFPHVTDSLVIEQKGKLVALVHFNREEIEEHYHQMKQEIKDRMDATIDELKYELQQYVNQRVNKFSQVQLVLVQPVPFEKTATMKIKRYLYL